MTMNSTEMIEKYPQTRSVNGHTDNFVRLRKVTGTLDLDERKKFQQALNLFEGLEYEAEAWLVTLFLVGDLQYTQYIDRNNIYNLSAMPTREEMVYFARGIDEFLSNNNNNLAFNRAAVAGVLALSAQRPVYDVFKDFYQVMVAPCRATFPVLNYVKSEFKAEIVRHIVKQCALKDKSIIYHHIGGYWYSMFSSVEDFAPYLVDYESHPNYEKFMKALEYLKGYQDIKKTNKYQDHKSYNILKKYNLNTPEITLLFDHIMSGTISQEIKNIFNISDTSNLDKLYEDIAARSKNMTTANFRAKTLFNSVYHVFQQKFSIAESSTHEERLFMIAAAYHFSFYILSQEKMIKLIESRLLLLTATYVDDIPALYRLPAEVRDTMIMSLLNVS